MPKRVERKLPKRSRRIFAGRTRGQVDYSISGVGFLGRPRERSVNSRLSRVAVLAIQASDPNGWPRFPRRRNVFNSVSVRGSLTNSAYRRDRGSGHEPNHWRSASGLRSRRHKLDHCQSSARLTKFARKAFRSTYRTTW
jgi:hypothetical protein